MNRLALLWKTCVKKLKDDMRAEYKRAAFKGSVADIFGARAFSEHLRMLMEREFTGVGRLFPKSNRLKADYRDLLQQSVLVERLWRSVRYEHVYKYAYDSVLEARAKSASYLDWYNQ